ncbi:MAG: hypothetical protein KC473_01190, partial [Candidatus Dadabacteria bacterium]|nr:hypothetical protein [Candidatus Dadabacteria bacterium]
HDDFREGFWTIAPQEKSVIYGRRMWYNKNIYIRKGVISMRSDIDIRLFDYFLYEHADVDKAHSLVTVPEKPNEEETEWKRPNSDKKDRNH